jgi:TIR domain-containing protein
MPTSARSNLLKPQGFARFRQEGFVLMSDIFVSYASADRERARLIADALASRGWSVWWDRTIPPGKEFDQVIEEALDSAKCVVVLWSKTSTASTWVKTEAAEAMRRKILVPALIDDIKIPLEFRRLQAADLSRWQGEHSDPELEKFFASIQANISGIGEPVLDVKPIPQPPPIRPRPIEPAPPIHANREQSASNSNTKLVLLSVVGVVAIVAILAGFFVYRERAKRVAFEQQIAREREEQAQRERTAQEEAAREAASRRAEEDRRAAERAAQAKATQANASRLQAERERAALEQRRVEYSPKTMSLDWNDNALRYSGTLSWTDANATLRFTAYDARTGARVGNYSFPAQVPSARGSGYVISGTVSVPGDSVSPYPHEHGINLYFNSGQRDGSLRLVQNCPRPGECYPAR